MLVWQLHQGQQQQLQGEANAKDTRQENPLLSPWKAKGFIFHPQPRLMGSFPNEAFDLFIFSPHRTEASFNSFGHWPIAKAAAKLSSQHRSICGKRLSLHFALCQLPWEEDEEEDVKEEVVTKGFKQDPTVLHGAGLHCLPWRTSVPPQPPLLASKDLSRFCKVNVLPLSLPVAPSAALLGFATCTFSFPSLLVWSSERREQAVPKLRSWGQEQGSSVFIPWDKTFDQITCLSCNKTSLLEECCPTGSLAKRSKVSLPKTEVGSI